MSASPKVHTIHNYYAGAFVPPIGGEYIDSLNPAKGTVNAKVPDSDSRDIDAAVQAAQNAFPLWSETTRQYRSKMLNKIADLLEEKLEEFAIAESEDQGKPISLARTVDIPRAIHNFRFFASYILHMEDKKTDLDGIAINYTQRMPVGVVTGCTCVLKPSEFTSVTAWKLCMVLSEAGLPPGVINMVFGTGPKAGSPLVSHPKVPMISFTGGTATGEIIYKACASNFKKMSLELGGKNANIIFADCDFDKALDTTVRSSFANQGEICLCGSRIFVERSIHDRFVTALAGRAEELIVGDPSHPDTNLGALVSKQHLDKVMSYVTLATQEGGRIAAFVIYQQLANSNILVPHDHATFRLPASARTCQEEIFGPVVTVIPFDTEEEVIFWANEVKYGLSASVWTESLKRAQRVSSKIHAGTVWVNCWMVRDLNMPFGGMKQSGLGREGAPYSFDFFCEEKTICMSLS
ncbi:Aldehyde dehydrogenase 8 member A1 [Blyttiomyces sp. JEL0837]|nr:Aldehyde dehydrogenase 8 member A1 [Blyttiomyces sp. JEL0837]